MKFIKYLWGKLKIRLQLKVHNMKQTQKLFNSTIWFALNMYIMKCEKKNLFQLDGCLDTCVLC